MLCEGPLTLEYKEDKELDGFVRPLLGFWRRTKGHIQNQSCQEAITPGKPICIASRTNLLINSRQLDLQCPNCKTEETLGLQTASVWNDILLSIRRVLESWNDWCIAATQMYKDSRIPAVSTRCNKKSSGMPLLSFGAVFSIKPYNARTKKKSQFQLICLNVCRCLWSDCL